MEMSDAASAASVANIVTTIVTGLVTIVTTLAGLALVWLKLKYGVATAGEAATEAATKAGEAVTKAGVVEGKIDNNTHITTQAKEAAEKAKEHTEACDEDRAKIISDLADHGRRIAALEGHFGRMQTSVEGVSKEVALLSKNLDQTRHAMKGDADVLSKKLDLLLTAPGMPRDH